MGKKICVIGLGYIGLPTAALFSYYGYDVLGVDVNENIITNLIKGKITITEPGLEGLTKFVVEEGSLKASLIPDEADIFIIAVPTPINKDKTANLQYVIEASRSIIKYLKKGNVVVLESTSPMGTTEEIVKPILEESGLKMGVDVFLGYCPERVIPGNIIEELIKNNRIVGGINNSSAIEIKKVYKTMVQGEIYLTNCKTAEMCKLMENTFTDVNIALSNELAMICESTGINAWEVIEYCNKHPRVNLMNPNPGVGGNYLAVDPWFIVEKEPDLANLIFLSRTINDNMPLYVYNKIINLMESDNSKKVTILGITYKADVDDIRESPIIKIIDILRANQIKVDIYDPYVKGYYLCKDNIIEACKNSDLLVIGVEHNDFKTLPLEEIRIVMKGNIILDTRNFLDSTEVKKYGFKYKILGDS